MLRDRGSFGIACASVGCDTSWRSDPSPDRSVPGDKGWRPPAVYAYPTRSEHTTLVRMWIIVAVSIDVCEPSWWRRYLLLWSMCLLRAQEGEEVKCYRAALLSRVTASLF